ncbi:MAG TPA: hypothetical protein VFI02_20195 [Armatimonadota bacterium]|nr:hypothetical protein [Armatimonadota bacterium]
MSRYILFLAVAVTCCNLASADTSLKPYSPFDEAKPRIPKEIMEDKRLDVKVNVFVKSKNFRDLFAEITKQTGVKLTADRKIAAERAIIYFHARPLRDVMAEVSGLFGYYWLPKGKEGEFTYELREDSRHAVHRDQLREAGKDAYEQLIVKMARDCAEGTKSEAMKKMLEDDPGNYDYLAGSYGRPIASIFARLGKDFMHRVLNGETIQFSFADLPSEVQSAMLEWNRAYEAKLAMQGEPTIQPLTAEDISNASIRFERVSYGTYRMPRLGFSINSGNHSHLIHWPLGLKEDDLWTLTGHQPPPEKLTGDKLPDEPGITLTAKRKDLRLGMEKEGLMLHFGDAMQGIAEQSGRDIIADHYFQQVFLRSRNKEPLGKLVKELCEKLDYSCQVDGSILRFRFNTWYGQPLMEEPPARLLEALWEKLETIGRPDFQSLISIVGLPGNQGSWPGLRSIPGMDNALRSPGSWNIWDSFGKDLEAKAQNEGLPVSQLSKEQLDQLAAWVKLVPWVESDRDLSTAMIRAIKPEANAVVTGPGESLIPAGSKCTMLGWLGSSYQFAPQTKPLSEEERKEAIAQRKADAEADKAEVVKP